MTKGKVKLDDYEMNGFVFVGLLLVLIICGALLGRQLTLEEDKCIFIPNSNMIEDFCKDNGYKSGWLSSSSCGINEVQCFKEIGQAKYYDCLKITPPNVTQGVQK